MIKDFEIFHGIVFARLISKFKAGVLIERYPTKSSSSYVINKEVGLYIKYSSSRMSPWSFSFKKEHQDEMLNMKCSLKKLFIIFVCNKDGIACLSFDEVKSVLDHVHEEVEWVRISRSKREKYFVSGSDGELKLKVGDSEFPRKLHLKSSVQKLLINKVVSKLRLKIA